MTQYICKAWAYNKVSTFSMSRVRENESLKDFQKRTSNMFPLEEGWHLEYSEWKTITI